MPISSGRPRTNEKALAKSEASSSISIYDEDDPSSIVNMVSDDIKEALHLIPPVYLTWGEKALEKHADLNPRDYRLRISIWNNYDHAIDRRTKRLSIYEALRGVCSRHYFETQVLTNPKKLAWVFFPPADYTKFMQECLDLSMRNMREVLMLPIKNDVDGKIDHKLIDQKIKIWEKVETRVKGTVPQALNVNQKSVNYNVNKNDNTSNPTSLLDIDAELAMLELEEKGPPKEKRLDKTLDGSPVSKEDPVSLGHDK